MIKTQIKLRNYQRKNLIYQICNQNYKIYFFWNIQMMNYKEI
jgi:hypothetical protein